MPTVAPPRHRWFQFGLRTMLLMVTVVAASVGFVAWAQRWAAARQAFIADMFLAPDASGRDANYGGYVGTRPNPQAGAPSPLRMMGLIYSLCDGYTYPAHGGTRTVADMTFRADDPSELVERARNLFPEARIIQLTATTPVPNPSGARVK